MLETVCNKHRVTVDSWYEIVCVCA